MRQAALALILATCVGLLLLNIEGLTLARPRKATYLILPDAADVQIEQSSLSRQQITYRLQPNQTPDDLYRQLVQTGWARDARGELGRLRNQRAADAFAVFWRQSWSGLVSEVLMVRRAARDQQALEIHLSRCFTLGWWMRCL